MKKAIEMSRQVSDHLVRANELLHTEVIIKLFRHHEFDEQYQLQIAFQVSKIFVGHYTASISLEQITALCAPMFPYERKPTQHEVQAVLSRLVKNRKLRSLLNNHRRLWEVNY